MKHIKLSPIFSITIGGHALCRFEIKNLNFGFDSLDQLLFINVNVTIDSS